MDTSKNDEGDNTSSPNDSQVDSLEGIGEICLNQRTIASDCKLVRQLLKYDGIDNHQRAELQRRLWGANTRAHDAGDTRALVATASAIIACDRVTLAANPPARAVEHTGVIGHRHAVVTLPAKASPPALPSP